MTYTSYYFELFSWNDGNNVGPSLLDYIYCGQKKIWITRFDSDTDSDVHLTSSNQQEHGNRSWRNDNACHEHHLVQYLRQLCLN